VSVSVSSRTWVAEGGYDGKGWTQRQIDDAAPASGSASTAAKGWPCAHGRVVLGGVGDLSR